MNPKFYVILTEDQVKEKIKQEVSVTVPIEGAKITASGNFLRKVKVSNTSLLQVVSVTIADPPTRAKKEDLKLTAKALEVLEGPDGPNCFTEQFGQ